MAVATGTTGYENAYEPVGEGVRINLVPRANSTRGYFFFWAHTGRMLFPNALPGAITLMTNPKLVESVLEELMERVRDGERV